MSVSDMRGPAERVAPGFRYAHPGYEAADEFAHRARSLLTRVEHRLAADQARELAQAVEQPFAGER
jgi:hypothetical protein